MKSITSIMIALTLLVAPAAAQGLPHVLVVSTGGTIASQIEDPMISGEDLIKAIPQLAQLANIKVHNISQIGSSKMTPKVWLKLLSFLHEYVDSHPQLAGIVITHGTDTMEETAFFLHLTYRRRVPVVLVGSMRTPDEISADGPANLYNAVRVSIDVQSADHGVLVAFNERIYSGRDLIKLHNRNVQTFAADDWGHLGSVDPDGIHFYRKSIRPHTIKSEFVVDQESDLPIVPIISDYTDFDVQLFSDLNFTSMRGIVVGSFAGGRISTGMTEFLQRIPESIPVVVASSVPGGRIVGKQNLSTSQQFYAHHFRPKKARILLQLALTQTSDLDELQSIFTRY